MFDRVLNKPLALTTLLNKVIKQLFDQGFQHSLQHQKSTISHG